MNEQKQPSLNLALGIATVLIACVAQLRAAEPQPPVKHLILPGESFLVQGLAEPGNVLMGLRQQDRKRRQRMSPESPEQQQLVKGWLS